VNPLRILLIGAGHMGRLHAEKVAALREAGAGIALAGVADIELGRAREVADKEGAPSGTDHCQLLRHADAAIVAVPTVAHFRVVRDVLEAGRDVLVEKPIAATVSEAEQLMALAQSRRQILQVGHLEWFNPAMQVIREQIRRPRFVEGHRMGPFPQRATDIDVVRDLMIHDLDILQQLLGEEPDRVEAVGIPVLTPNVDIANARLSYPGGCVANLTASRVSPTPMRKIRFFQPNGYFSIDFLEQSAVVFRRERAGEEVEPEIQIERPEVSRGDALLAQLRSFLDALRTRVQPDGAALGALRTALRVIDSMPSLDELE
jgi:predicted dehydrogenase